MKRILLTITLMVLIAGMASAQTVTGYVLAPSNNALTVMVPVGGAVVTLSSLATTSNLSQRWTTVSGNNGEYSFQFNTPLRPGTYVLTAVARGYLQSSRVTISVNHTSTTPGIIRANIYMIPVRPSPTSISSQ